MKDALLLFIIFESSALLIGALGIPMWQRKIKPNRAYGFRTKLTLQNPKIWYEVNAVSGMQMAYFGVIMAVASAVLLLLHEKMAIVVFLLIYVVVLITGLIIITVKGIALARKLHDQGWGGKE